jgi:hypothetical protein
MQLRRGHRLAHAICRAARHPSARVRGAERVLFTVAVAAGHKRYSSHRARTRRMLRAGGAWDETDSRQALARSRPDGTLIGGARHRRD